MSYRNVWRAGAVLLIAALTVLPVSAQESKSKEGLATVTLPEELAQVLRSYEASWVKSDAAGLAALFTEDGYVLRPGRSPVHGREAILAAYKNSGGPLALKAYAYETEGNVGYIIGGYSMDPKSPEVGKFVLALRRDDSGKWLIVADIDNGN